MQPKSGRPNWLIWLVYILGGMGSAGALNTSPAETSPLSVEDALSVRQFSQLLPISVSHDGRWVAYTIQDSLKTRPTDLYSYTQTGSAPWSVGSQICVMNLKTGKVETLGDGRSNNWLPEWSPNGRLLAFLSDRDSDSQARVWVWDPLSGRTREISSVSVRGTQIQWTPDSRNLLVTTVPSGLSLAEFVAQVTGHASPDKNPTAAKHESSVVVYHGRPDPQSSMKEHSDAWNLDVTLRDLTLMNVGEGTVTTIVHGARIGTFLLSPNGSRIAYTIARYFERPGSQQVLFNLVICGLTPTHERLIAANIRFNHDGDSFSWSPDGTHLGFCANGKQEKTLHCQIAALDDKIPQLVTVFLGPVTATGVPPRPVWDSNGHIYFTSDGALWQASARQSEMPQAFHVSNREITSAIRLARNTPRPELGMTIIVGTHDPQGKQDGFYGINLESGESTKLLENGQCYTCSSVPELTTTDDPGSIFFFAEDAEHDQDLWIADEQFHNQRRLSHLNPQFDRHPLGSARLVRWLSDDGRPLEGSLLFPAGYKKNVRYPLVVWVYGGVSFSSKLDHFGLVDSGPFNMQILAAHGYAVLMPDAPQELGTPMLDLAKTVLPAVNKVIEMGVADPNQLALIGHSYGGYSALALIVQTRRFKTAIVADATGDLLAAYGQMRSDGTSLAMSIEEQGQGLMGSTPWMMRDRYIENSPIYYLDRIETPLLIIEGANDTTIAPFLTDELFVDLRRLGKEVEYAKYADEGHSPLLWRYADQLDFCTRMLSWLDTHLRK